MRVSTLKGDLHTTHDLAPTQAHVTERMMALLSLLLILETPNDEWKLEYDLRHIKM